MTPPRYPIRAVSRLTGISVDTLRAWERRYRVVVPERDERGRLYTEGDVERLRLLRGAVEQGHPIGRVAKFSTEELQGLLTSGVTRAAPRPAPASPTDLSVLFDAVTRFDVFALRSELTRLGTLLPPRALATEVALPFMHLVGEAWHEGRLTIAQEHMVSAEVRSLVGTLARLEAAPERAPRLVLGTPAGELHELGTLAAALVAAASGAAPLYLGPNLPAGEFTAGARQVRARVVALGYTGSESAPAGVACIAELARQLPPDVALWVGGAGAEEARAAAPGRVTALADFAAYERALAELRPG